MSLETSVNNNSEDIKLDKTVAEDTSNGDGATTPQKCMSPVQEVPVVGKSEGRVSPVTLKLSKTPETTGSVLEMLVEKVKARENNASPTIPKPVIGLEEGKVADHIERKRRASNDSEDSSMTKASESNTDDIKDDEEENEDDDLKISPGENIDPERLKAFNMFVRLFVDENLDRTVPISKQPKDKIQAILEACDRQFAEFHERARKRVRTYLKSCRRLKKSKDGGFEQVKQTPPHLTSAAAESILAQACENESENAKRMRMGLEPLPAHLMNSSNTTRSERSTPTNQNRQDPPINNSITPSHELSISHRSRSPTVEKLSNRKRQSNTPDYNQLPIKSANTTTFRPPRDLNSATTPFSLTNGNGLFRSGFPAAFTSPPAHHHPSPLLQNSLSPQVQNGPTDLSMKNSKLGSTNLPKKPQLSPQEVATIKSLIAGYRESAAFLYRSAEELEQILLQQN